MVKSVGNMEVIESFSHKKHQEVRSHAATIGRASLDMTGAHQADIDTERSRIVYSVNGKLFAADRTSIKEVCDLAESQFEPVPPPDWAKQWP
jgi:hypothetical protein